MMEPPTCRFKGRIERRRFHHVRNVTMRSQKSRLHVSLAARPLRVTAEKSLPADARRCCSKPIIEPGDRVTIEGENQKAGRIFSASALAKVDPGADLHDLHKWCRLCWAARPSRVFRATVSRPPGLSPMRGHKGRKLAETRRAKTGQERARIPHLSRTLRPRAGGSGRRRVALVVDEKADRDGNI